MADITNQEAIHFINEAVRPLAEKLRALKIEADAAITQWFAGKDTLIPNDSSPVVDGRENEGVSRLTGADVNSLMVQLLAFQTACNVSDVDDVIAKPCVRTVTVPWG